MLGILDELDLSGLLSIDCGRAVSVHIIVQLAIAFLVSNPMTYS